MDNIYLEDYELIELSWSLEELLLLNEISLL